MKLVRDKIPDIIKEKGGSCVIRFPYDDNETYKFVDEKIDEEYREWRESGDEEELADLVEIIYEMVQLIGLTPGEFDKIIKKKRLERGGFDKKIILVSTKYEGYITEEEKLRNEYE